MLYGERCDGVHLAGLRRIEIQYAEQQREGNRGEQIEQAVAREDQMCIRDSPWGMRSPDDAAQRWKGLS